MNETHAPPNSEVANTHYRGSSACRPNKCSELEAKLSNIFLDYRRLPPITQRNGGKLPRLPWQGIAEAIGACPFATRFRPGSFATGETA